MSNTATNVSVGKPAAGGAISYAPVGTTLPTSATASLDAAFVTLGYASEDGLTNSMSIDTNSIKAWGGDTVLTLQTSFEDTFGFKLIEALNDDVLTAVFGSSNVVESGGAITVKVNSKERSPMSWVVDMVATGNKLKRIVIPSAKITEIGEITYNDSDAIGYDVTLTATPESAGQTHYEYIAAAPTT